ncbi:hypothetical protein SJAV_21860 [Sulfurisphaera javensis]|uniref:DUF3211 domain-containing protein n=1 Tax=Sulfurisphaera javensis TaxID=2049879 RepID=A0AAT9GUG8_9CREN
MIYSERIKFDHFLLKIIKRPELFVPLTYHFHLVEKGERFISLLYPREDIKDVKIEEHLQKFILIYKMTPQEVTYVFDNEKGIKYTITITSNFISDKYLTISIISEKKGFLKSLPISEEHILTHIIENVKYLVNE